MIDDEILTPIVRLCAENMEEVKSFLEKNARVILCAKRSDGTYKDITYQELRVENDSLRELAEIGRKWKENSALEEWFPITAEELQNLRAENERLKAVERHMDYCRSLLNCPTDDVLADRIKQIQEALKAAKEELISWQKFNQVRGYGECQATSRALAKIEEAMKGEK